MEMSGARCLHRCLGRPLLVWRTRRGTCILSRVDRQMWNDRGREPRTGNGEKLDLEIPKFPITDKPLIPP